VAAKHRLNIIEIAGKIQAQEMKFLRNSKVCTISDKIESENLQEETSIQ
jgi:hypothetical protein